MKRIGIIGGGRFGLSLAESLAEAGQEVLLVDRNGSVVQNAAKTVTFAIQGDATNPEALRDAGLAECDVVVVAVGTNLEVSTLATANCKEIGVKTVVAKAVSEIHGRILRKIGADEVVYPERESAFRLARSLTGRSAFDLLEVSEGFSIAEIDAPAFCADKTLSQLDMRNRYGVTVLCFRRVDENPRKPRAIVVPGPNDVIHGDDKLIVFGTTKHIAVLTTED